MKYVEIFYDDYIIIYLNRHYFCLPIFIYEQIPTRIEIVTYIKKVTNLVCKNVPIILSNIVSKTLKIKRTKRLW